MTKPFTPSIGRVLCSTAVGLLLLSGAACGQWSASVLGDVALRSRYDWRGITRHNGFVVQPDVLAAVHHPFGFFTAGVWANIEVTKADPRIEEAIGLGSRAGEVNGWVEATGILGPAEFAAGWTAYHFYDHADAAAVHSRVYNTHELYGRAQARLWLFTPKVQASFDVDEVGGGYIEPSVLITIPAIPLGMPAVFVGALAGFSFGQDSITALPDEGYHYEGDGLTHWDVSLMTQIFLPLSGIWSHIYLTPEFHVQFNEDPLTKIDTGLPDDSDHARKCWFGLSVSIYR